jgi:dienelactone hydrolase
MAVRSASARFSTRDHYVVRPPAGTQVRAYAVFFHGLGGMGGSQDAFVKAMAADGIFVIVPQANQMVPYDKQDGRNLREYVWRETKSSMPTSWRAAWQSLTRPRTPDSNQQGFAAGFGVMRLAGCVWDVVVRHKIWYSLGFGENLSPDIGRTVGNAAKSEVQVRGRIDDILDHYRGTDTGKPLLAVGWSMGSVMAAIAMTQSTTGRYDAAVMIGIPYLACCPDPAHTGRDISVIMAKNDPLRPVLGVHDNSDIESSMRLYRQRYGCETYLESPDEAHHDLSHGVAAAARRRVAHHVAKGRYCGTAYMAA